MRYKPFFLLALILTCFLVFAEETRYEIKLKKGGRIIVSRYWEDKGQIKAQKGEMVVGFRKEAILSISEIKGKESEKTGEPAAPVPTDAKSAEEIPGKATPNAADGNASTTTAPAADCPAKEPPTQKEILIRKNRIKSDLELVVEQMRQARLQKDEQGYQKAYQEMNELSRRYYSLENEVKSRNEGQLPSWWKEN